MAVWLCFEVNIVLSAITTHITENVTRENIVQKRIEKVILHLTFEKKIMF
jgi:hypothetical protein